MNIALRLSATVPNLLNGEEGQDLVEYVLLASMIALAAIASITPIAGALTTMFSNISTSI